MAVLLIVLNWLPGLDDRAETYLSEAITDNLVIYATARSLNGIISVIQSIELSVNLGAGVGVNFGEILDPLNDLIERFSGFVLYGLAGLGLQKLVLLATSSLVMKITTTVTIAVAFIIWLWKDLMAGILIRALLILLLVRFAFVIEVGVIAGLDALYFDQQKDEAHSILKLTRNNLANLRQEYMHALAEKGVFGGLWETIETLVGTDEQEGMTNLAASAVVDLMVITIIRGLVLPLAFVWMLVLLVGRLSRPTVTSYQVNL